ncbi:hypothetical protein NM04_06370 [Massilia aurea]|uniref:Uncharacterized protein n=1 Tax=Massilia aurea TaxID=373040 RepID=A0A422QNM4_9BURK|nr:hypothetical protein [Massilia aurea]RNF31619.1 hypothetical protein NM04_06370 [Massilia aurea]
MTPQTEAHIWSAQALFYKALIYSERMANAETESAERAFWSAAMLELLARATLSNISPILLADEKNWRNLSFALGKHPTTKRFNPVSIGIKEVLVRLNELEPRITSEITNFCASHFDKRNSELHSGEFAFANYRSSTWLPKFYHAAEVFLVCLNKSIEDLFSEVDHIRGLIDSLSDQAAQSVTSDISAYKKVWSDKSADDKTVSEQRAKVWSSRHTGHRVQCPACSCDALIYGTPAGMVTTRADEDGIEQKQGQLPASFECIACGLRITGYSKLAACSLGDMFTETTRFEPSEFYGLFTEADIESAVDEAERNLKNHFEPDFND